MTAVLPSRIEQLLDTLDEQQLHVLYHRIVDRLRLLHQARDLQGLAQFHVLDRVSFVHNGMRYTGVVTRLNRKTATVITDQGGHWNVSPRFLSRIIDADASTPPATDG